MIVILICEERYKDMNCHHSFVNNFKQLWTIQTLKLFMIFQPTQL